MVKQGLSLEYSGIPTFLLMLLWTNFTDTILGGITTKSYSSWVCLIIGQNKYICHEWQSYYSPSPDKLCQHVNDTHICIKVSLHTYLLLTLLPIAKFTHKISHVHGLLQDHLVQQAQVGVMMSDLVRNLLYITVSLHWPCGSQISKKRVCCWP